MAPLWFPLSQTDLSIQALFYHLYWTEHLRKLHRQTLNGWRRSKRRKARGAVGGILEYKTDYPYTGGGHLAFFFSTNILISVFGLKRSARRQHVLLFALLAQRLSPCRKLSYPRNERILITMSILLVFSTAGSKAEKNSMNQHH